jgi:RNA polymerase primary sigma factor
MTVKSELQNAPACNFTDPFAAYLKEIKGNRKLDSKEEKILAARIHRGDNAAFRTLVEANLKFVVLVCRRYENQGLPLIDLINEGNLGLMRAASRFDESRDLKFISYAVWWIRQGIMEALSKQSRSISTPPNTGAVIHTINKASRKLEQKLGRRPSPEELELETGMDAKRIREYQRIAEPMLSLNYETEDGNTGLLDKLSDISDSGTEQEIERFEARETAQWLLASLDDREKEIMTLYFGIRSGHPVSLDEICIRFGVCKERIRQIKNETLLKLKRKLRRAD